MIATVKMDVILKNEKDNFEMLTYEVGEVADEIEVYSCFFNP